MSPSLGGGVMDDGPSFDEAYVGNFVDSTPQQADLDQLRTWMTRVIRNRGN